MNKTDGQMDELKGPTTINLNLFFKKGVYNTPPNAFE